MSNTHRLKRRCVAGAPVLLAALALAGCGGGSGSSSETAAPAAAVADAESVPPGAAASVQSLVDFQQGLAASNTTEPLKVSGFLPPNSDTAEPFAIK